MTIFILGGYSGTPWIWTLWQFSFGGILGYPRFGLYDNFHLGGVFWETSDLDSMTIFIFGGTLERLGFGLYDNFHFRGYSQTPWIWTLWQFSFWGVILGHLRFGLYDNFHLGVFWDTSDLDSMTIFICGEYSGTPWIWILWQFSFWGGSILGHLGFGLYDNFHFGGYSGTPWIWTVWQFSFGGVFWDTLDLDSLTIFTFWGYSGHLGFGFYENFHFVGVFWDTSDLESMTIFILVGYSGTPQIWTVWQFSFWGGYSGTAQIWTLWQYSFGGILGHLRFGLYDNFHFGGIFWDTSDLESLTIFIWGYSGTPWVWTPWKFSLGGSILGHLGFGLPDNFHFGGIFWNTWY